MSEQTNTPQEEPQLSPEQIKKILDTRTKYYKDQLPLLKAQLEYETILADIEESRAKRLTMSIRIAQMMAGPSEDPNQEQELQEESTENLPEQEVVQEKKGPRKLKSQE